MFQIGVIGDLFIDIMACKTKIPQWGHAEQAQKITIDLGGSAYNTASVLAHLGTSCKLYGTISSDFFGNLYLSKLKNQNKITPLLDISGVKILDKESAICIILSGENDRAFIDTYGTIKAMTLDNNFS